MSIEIIISLIAALGVGGILGALLNRRFEQQKQINDHDMKIFTQSNEILTEQKLHDITEFHLSGDHSINDDGFSALTKWCGFFEQTGNQYLDKRINKENQKLVNSSFQLTDFIARNFFTIKGQNPHNKNKYLKPDWNLDRGGNPTPEKEAKYDEYANKLEILTRETLKCYAEYRLSIKRILKI